MKKEASNSVMLSPCQIVSWNLERRRRAKGWSQAEMAKRLAPYIGYRMSRSALSKAERSLHGGPIRRWDADEIFALARIFETQVGNFFLPPEPHFRGKRVAINSIPGEPKARVTASPLSRDETTDLVIAIGGSDVDPAVTKELMGLVISMIQRANERALRGYLEDHPERLRDVLTQGFPPAALEAREPDRTAAEEQKLFNRSVEIIEKSTATAKGKQR